MAGHLPIWSATVPWMCPVCPTKMSRLSRGPSAQFVPICREIGPGRPGCFETRPQTVPGTLVRHTDHQPNIFMCVLFIGDLFSLRTANEQRLLQEPAKLFLPQGGFATMKRSSQSDEGDLFLSRILIVLQEGGGKRG